MQARYAVYVSRDRVTVTVRVLTLTRVTLMLHTRTLFSASTAHRSHQMVYFSRASMSAAIVEGSSLCSYRLTGTPSLLHSHCSSIEAHHRITRMKHGM
jgi:hypothetical protein